MQGIFSWIRHAVKQAVIAGFRDGIEEVGGVVDASDHEMGNGAFVTLVSGRRMLDEVPQSVALSNGQKTRKGVVR